MSWFPVSWRGTNSVYTANNLNQYTSISNFASSAFFAAEFIPQFDDDGNQTLIKTSTGIWSVTYNGENRPTLWTLVNSATHNSSTPTLISMSYDRMGRRVTKNGQRFVYDGYLQITDNSGNTYIWDPSEPVATRPLVWNHSALNTPHSALNYYTHDGNKNVSEVIAENGDTEAHYEYAPFGSVTALSGERSSMNPWRFSSECADDEQCIVCYNYRCYNPINGRWMNVDLFVDTPRELSFAYMYVGNNVCQYYDSLGDRAGPVMRPPVRNPHPLRPPRPPRGSGKPSPSPAQRPPSTKRNPGNRSPGPPAPKPGVSPIEPKPDDAADNVKAAGDLAHDEAEKSEEENQKNRDDNPWDINQDTVVMPILAGENSCQRQLLKIPVVRQSDKDPNMKYWEAKVCKCCEIVIAWQDWHTHDSSGRSYGFVSATLHVGKSCEEVKQIQQLWRHIEDGGYLYFYNDYNDYNDY